MIDTANRHAAAELLRQFVRKERTGADVHKEWPRSAGDPAISEINYLLVADNIDEAGMFSESQHMRMLPVIERCIVFLDSDLPYEWPQELTWRRILLPGCLLYPLVVLVPALAIAWLIMMVWPVAPPAGGFIAGGVGAVSSALIYVFVVPMIHARRMSRQSAGAKELWPFRDSDDAAREK